MTVLRQVLSFGVPRRGPRRTGAIVLIVIAALLAACSPTGPSTAGASSSSVTILGGPDVARKRAMLREIEQTDPKYRAIPIYLSRFGLRV